MQRHQQIIISIGTTVAGLVLCGFAATASTHNAITTVSVVAGIALSVFGFISVVLLLKSKKP